MARRAFIIIFMAAFMLSGCASRGFDRGALQQSLMDEKPVITSEEIKEALALKPQLRFPIRLGVFFDTYRKYEPSYYGENVTHAFSGEDKDAVLSSLGALRDAGIVSDMFIIPEAFVSSPDPEAVRLAAARQGADAVLHIKGAFETDMYFNPAAFLYLTIVGMWVVPGSNYETLFMTSGAMYDVGNGYIYLAIESDAKGKTSAPLTFLREETAVKRAKNGALESFREEFLRRIKSLKGT